MPPLKSKSSMEALETVCMHFCFKENSELTEKIERAKIQIHRLLLERNILLSKVKEIHSDSNSLSFNTKRAF